MGFWDLFKRKPKTSELTSEVGAPSTAGVRTIWHDPVATGLTPQVLASILTSAAEGDIVSYLTLAGEMEERDLHYGGVLSTRKTAVAKLPFQVEAASEDAEDLEIADELRAMLMGLNTRHLIRDLMDAVGKGYSAVEIVWETSEAQWQPKKLVWRDPRFFQFDQDTMSELRLRDVSAPVDGLELQPYKWLIHYPHIKTGIPIRGGLARLVSFAHMCKSYSLKDWVAFAEVFGMPIRVGKYPPAATESDQLKLLTAVANLGTDAAAIIPENMALEFVTQSRGSTGSAVYRDLANYLDKQVSKGVLGQTMTTDDGSSLAQAKVHGEVREDIREADALEVDDTINEHLVAPWVALNYGDGVACPRAQLPLPKQEDLVKFSEAAGPMIDRGLPVEVAQVLDKFGLTEPADGADILHPEGQGEKVGGDEKSAQRLLRALNQATARGDQDAVDDLVALGLRDWQKQMDPVIAPILELAEQSESYEEFEGGLELVLEQMDTTHLVRRLATTMFEGRGLGDATDDV